MTVKIVHFSDLHGSVVKLPAADVYVCTGDSYKDVWEQTLHGWQPDPVASEKAQLEFLDSLDNPRELYFENPDAAIVHCRGNHCRVSPKDSFGGEFYEIGKEATSFTVKGIKFGGFRGTNYIGPGFADGLMCTRELGRSLDDDLDVVVTHAPPQGILDEVLTSMGPLDIGMVGLRNYIDKSNLLDSNLKLSLFGHVHEEFGYKKVGNVLCCNSATGYSVIQLGYDGEWRVIESKAGVNE